MIVRWIALACCMVGVAYGQTPEERILSALEDLRAQETVFLQLLGSQQKTPSVRTALDTRAYLVTDKNLTPNELKVDVRQYRDDKLVSRIVGDGKTVWGYSNTNFEYSANPYGRWSTTEVPNYRQDLFDLMAATSSEEVALMVRLLSHAFAGKTAASFAGWIPGAQATDGPDDPNDVVYTFGDPIVREVVFDLEAPSDETGSYKLKGVEFLDKKTIQGTVRETGWRIYVRDLAQVSSDMSFAPYGMADLVGWKKVTKPRPAIQ